LLFPQLPDQYPLNSYINGTESAQTNPKLASSVNNFAYHISLETPHDGRDDEKTHSGYTENQYASLLWLIQKLNVPVERITTHYAVDRSGTRKDPRSFDFNRLPQLANTYNLGAMEQKKNPMDDNS
jgi:N-acetyl-anhydromuramyl-L-alanine amidase AmpD